jgi:hypothetical protein
MVWRLLLPKDAARQHEPFAACRAAPTFTTSKDMQHALVNVGGRADITEAYSEQAEILSLA